MTDDSPVAACDGNYFPGLIDQGVPSVATVIDDVVEGFEDSVRQPVLAHELPDVFLAIEFGRARRQRHQRDVARHLENFGAMPASLIEEQNCVCSGADLGRDLIGEDEYLFTKAVAMVCEWLLDTEDKDRLRDVLKEILG